MILLLTNYKCNNVKQLLPFIIGMLNEYNVKSGQWGKLRYFRKESADS